MSNSSVWPIDRTLSGATTPGQSRPGSDGNEAVLQILQRSPGPLANTLPTKPMGRIYNSSQYCHVSLAPNPGLFVGSPLIYCVLGTNSLPEPIPLQVYNWFEFNFPSPRPVTITRLGLVWFYGISTIVDNLMTNPVYTYKSNIHDL